MLYLSENKAEKRNNYKIFTDWTARTEFPDVRMNIDLAYGISWDNPNMIGKILRVL